MGLIDRVPRLAVINATGADTLFQLYERGLRWNGGAPDMSLCDAYCSELDAAGRRASTIASAIEINRPVNLTKCLRALEICDGVVREVTDQEILDAKAAKVSAGGLGCELAVPPRALRGQSCWSTKESSAATIAWFASLPAISSKIRRQRWRITQPIKSSSTRCLAAAA